MTQKEKDLLLKDLCARLPYGVKCQFEDTIETIKEIWFCEDEGWQVDGEKTSTCIHAVKPYLFPLSSMTEEQLYELRELFGFEIEFGDGFIELSTFYNGRLGYLEMDTLFEWFDRNHFDYRGLIPMGLALNATGLNIY